MTPDARTIAAAAANQARESAAAKRARETAARQAEEKAKAARHAEAAAAGRALLAPMFPGVEWTDYQAGDYGFDTILMEQGADWSDPLKIKVERYLTDMNAGPSGGYTTRLYMTTLQQDTSMPGYSYWTRGREVKSAADVGLALEGS